MLNLVLDGTLEVLTIKDSFGTLGMLGRSDGDIWSVILRSMVIGGRQEWVVVEIEETDVGVRVIVELDVSVYSSDLTLSRPG
jgi:hypothetical protein